MVFGGRPSHGHRRPRNVHTVDPTGGSPRRTALLGMEALLQRLRRRKPKREITKDTHDQRHWRSWFRTSKDSARDLLPCFGHYAATTPPSSMEPTVQSAKPSSGSTLPEPEKIPSVNITLTPNIIVTEQRDLFGHEREAESHTSSSHFLEIQNGHMTPSISSSQPSPATSRSSVNQLYPLAGDAVCAFLRRLSVGSAQRKLGLEGAQRARYHWTLVRQYICFSFAIRGERRKPWVQLAGHAGSFQTGDCGTVLKKLTPEEQHSLEALMEDAVKPFVPLYMGRREIDGQDYIEMRDLLTGFDSAVSVMDCKLGIRTYLEEELTKAKEKPTMRPDMYMKMIEVDENEPTAEEHAQRAVTKPRYMQWRETISSTATLGFRVEGVKKPDGFSSKDYKFTKRKDDVVDVFKHFTDCNTDIIQIYIHRLKDLRKAVAASVFFASHEVVGSSLLLIHDTNGLAGVWMIDFAKTVPLPSGVQIDHLKEWHEGNHEDGYLVGLNNVISCFEDILSQKTSCAR